MKGEGREVAERGRVERREWRSVDEEEDEEEEEEDDDDEEEDDDDGGLSGEGKL